MLLLPPGEFAMGASQGDRDALREREAAAPRSHNEAVLPGQVPADPGPVGRRYGREFE